MDPYSSPSTILYEYCLSCRTRPPKDLENYRPAARTLKIAPEHSKHSAHMKAAAVLTTQRIPFLDGKG